MPIVTRARLIPQVPPPRARAMPTTIRAWLTRGLRVPPPAQVMRTIIPAGQRILERQQLRRLGATGYGATALGSEPGELGRRCMVGGIRAIAIPTTAAGGLGGVSQQPGGVPQQSAGTGYNYSQPISTTSAPAEQAVAGQATSAFDQARDAFKAGDYTKALQLDQQAITQTPNDTNLHEFLALVYFAQGKYDKAAEPLYAVLSVGPGWDWTTLSGMYPDVETYTRSSEPSRPRQREPQIRPPPASFWPTSILSQGHNENAIAQLKATVKLQPGDTLSPQLIAKLQPAGPPSRHPPMRPQTPHRLTRRKASRNLDGHAGQGRQGRPGDQGGRQV